MRNRLLAVTLIAVGALSVALYFFRAHVLDLGAAAVLFAAAALLARSTPPNAN